MSETDDLSSEQLPTLGDEVQASPTAEMLVQARQGKNLSQQDVADKLFLTVNYIKYIDDARFDKIPKPAYIRGYLRSYARVVGLVGDEVVNCFEEANGKTNVEADSLQKVTDEEVGPAKFTGPVAQTGFLGLAGIGLLIFLVSWLTSPEEESPEDRLGSAEQFIASSTEPISQDDIESIPQQMDAARIAADDRIAQPDSGSHSGLISDSLLKSSQRSVAGDSVAEPRPETAVAGSVTPVSAREDDEQIVQQRDFPDESTVVAEPFDAVGDESLPLVLAEKASIERYQEGGYTVISVRSFGEDHLQFTFVDECWLEVEDAGQDVIYADLHHAGDVVEIYGQAPFRILIGRAQSVILLFNDQPYSLVPHILNGTAKLVVGN